MQPLQRSNMSSRLQMARPAPLPLGWQWLANSPGGHHSGLKHIFKEMNANLWTWRLSKLICFCFVLFHCFFFFLHYCNKYRFQETKWVEMNFILFCLSNKESSWKTISNKNKAVYNFENSWARARVCVCVCVCVCVRERERERENRKENIKNKWPRAFHVTHGEL
jgi:hypothetical protein